jgi:hypothetical protein
MLVVMIWLAGAVGQMLMSIHWSDGISNFDPCQPLGSVE